MSYTATAGGTNVAVHDVTASARRAGEVVASGVLSEQQ